MLPKLIFQPGVPEPFSYLLPPGLHRCEQRETKQLLVTDFNTSTTRLTIWNGLLRYISDCQSLGINGRVWLDGSFTTGKNHPGDVDVVSLVSLDLLESLPSQDVQNAFDLLDGGEETKKDYFVHSFLVVCPPEAHPVYQASLEECVFWRNFFGYTRPYLIAPGVGKEVPKGLVDWAYGSPVEVAKIDQWIGKALKEV